MRRRPRRRWQRLWTTEQPGDSSEDSNSSDNSDTPSDYNPDYSNWIVGSWQLTEEEGVYYSDGEKKEYKYVYTDDPESYEIILSFNEYGQTYIYDAVTHEIEEQGVYSFSDELPLKLRIEYADENDVEIQEFIVEKITQSELIIFFSEGHEWGEEYQRMTFKKMAE